MSVIATGLVVAAIALALNFMRSGADDKAVVAETAKQIPLVTAISPGRSSVDNVVHATGSLAARREMPIGVVGEGGRVMRVLVEPGDWVRAGQALATIERSVQTQQARSLAAQVEVARADARLAEAELDRAQALVGRGFISKADIEIGRATRDAARAREAVALAPVTQYIRKA